MSNEKMAKAARDIDAALDLVYSAQGAIDAEARSSLDVLPHHELSNAILPLHRARTAASELATRVSGSEA